MFGVPKAVRPEIHKGVMGDFEKATVGDGWKNLKGAIELPSYSSSRGSRASVEAGVHAAADPSIRVRRRSCCDPGRRATAVRQHSQGPRRGSEWTTELFPLLSGETILFS
jgi:hypothetical protein